MPRAHQIVLPTDDLRGSLIAQIHALRKALGRTESVLNRSVNKQYGVTQGIADLNEHQLSAVLISLEQLMVHEEEVERVREACSDNGFSRLTLDELLAIHFEGRELGQLSVSELIDLRLRVESRGSRTSAAERETAVEVVM